MEYCFIDMQSNTHDTAPSLLILVLSDLGPVVPDILRVVRLVETTLKDVNVMMQNECYTLGSSSCCLVLNHHILHRINLQTHGWLSGNSTVLYKPEQNIKNAWSILSLSCLSCVFGICISHK